MRKKAMIVACSASLHRRSDLEIDENLIITKYDKRTNEKLNYLNAGVMVLHRDVISTTVDKNPLSLEEEILAPLISTRDVCAYITTQYFYDIGTFEGLEIFKSWMRKDKQ